MTGGEREVVKLSMGEGLPSLNVLPVGLEGDTLTLLCPFPVLPVEVPVNVTLPGDDDGRQIAAMIRRVGVEMMGEIGIPRFKLQLDLTAGGHDAEMNELPIVVDDGQFELEFERRDDAPHPHHNVFEVIDEMAEDDAAAASPADEVDLLESTQSDDSEDGAPASVPDIREADMSWTAGEMLSASVGGPKELKNPMLTWGESGDGEALVDDDPPWVAEHDPQVVHAALDDSARRRSRWPIRTAIVLTLIVSALAIGYEMREQIAPLVSPFIGEELTLAALGMAPARVSSAPDVATPEEAGVGERSDPSSAAVAATAPVAEADQEVTDETESTPDPSVEASSDQLRVILPTRWPVTEARSYRLNEPTGIVVDVPGGMASERARWIDTAHERVRSVRVLERSDGVRFIIYLNDESVPRYRVGYSRSGVTVDIMGPDPRHMAANTETPATADGA